MKPLEEIPSSSWVEIRVITTLAAGLAGLALTGGLLSFGGSIILPTALSSGFLSAVLMWVTLNPRSAEPPDGGSLLGRGCLYGGLNAFPSFLLTSIATGETGWALEAPLVLLAVGICGLIVGVPLGLLYSGAYTIPFHRAKNVLATRAIEGPDVMLKQSGAWLAAIALAGFAFGLLVGIRSCGDAFTPGRQWEQLSMLLFTCGPALIVGVVATLMGERRIRARRAWLWRVRQGQEQDFSLLPKSRMGHSEVGIRPLLIETRAPTHVIVRERSGILGGAYRTEKELLPIASISIVDDSISL